MRINMVDSKLLVHTLSSHGNGQTAFKSPFVRYSPVSGPLPPTHGRMMRQQFDLSGRLKRYRVLTPKYTRRVRVPVYQLFFLSPNHSWCPHGVTKCIAIYRDVALYPRRDQDANSSCPTILTDSTYG